MDEDDLEKWKMERLNVREVYVKPGFFSFIGRVYDEDFERDQEYIFEFRATPEQMYDLGKLFLRVSSVMQADGMLDDEM